MPRLDQAREQTRSAQRFWLEYHGRTFELRPGEILIGRSSNCHLVLDDGLVSRRHAQIIVTEDRITVEDFSRANGDESRVACLKQECLRKKYVRESQV